MQNRMTILADQPFLKGMTTEQLELMAKDSLPASFQAGEWIVKEGGIANRFYLILEGKVELASPVFEGEPAHVQTLGPGDLLGWSWLFPPYCWHFDARAATHIHAICFYGTHLRELCETNHDFGYELMKRVAETVVKRLHATRLDLANHNKNLVPPV